MVCQKNINKVVEEYELSAPFNHAIIDNFLEDEFCDFLRLKLLQHGGWRYINWINRQLQNQSPNISEIKLLVDAIEKEYSSILLDSTLVNYWAIMYHENEALHPHADDSRIQLTIWLTPEKHNLDPNTGGLLIFDVKRTSEMMIHEYSSNPFCIEYFQKNTKGDFKKIDYKYNRAIFFDGTIFHSTDKILFSNSSSESCRMTLSFSFDNPYEYAQRRKAYVV